MKSEEKENQMIRQEFQENHKKDSRLPNTWLCDATAMPT